MHRDGRNNLIKILETEYEYKILLYKSSCCEKTLVHDINI